jgi:hypothetical protein
MWRLAAAYVEIGSRKCAEFTESPLAFSVTASIDRLKAAFFLCNSRSRKFKSKPTIRNSLSARVTST